MRGSKENGLQDEMLLSAGLARIDRAVADLGGDSSLALRLLGRPEAEMEVKIIGEILRGLEVRLGK